MRIMVGILVVLGMAAPVPAWAGDREKALAVIERGIKAHGGEDALNKAQKRERRGRGEMTINKDKVPFSTEEIVQLPQRCRMVMEIGRNRTVLVLNGEKGWLKSPAGSLEIPKDELEDKREEAYVWWLMTLTPLRKDEFTLTPLPEAKVNGQPAAVIKAESKGHGEVRLYFDKQTGLLAKIRRRAVVADVPFSKEYYYSDFRDYDGAKLPSKEIIMQYGQKIFEVKFTHYKMLSSIEDSTFNKP